jgi:hypothetical protein
VIAGVLDRAAANRGPSDATGDRRTLARSSGPDGAVACRTSVDLSYTSLHIYSHPTVEKFMPFHTIAM